MTVDQLPTTRVGFRDRYADLTKADVAVALLMADTPDEVDAAAHLSLALFDVAGTFASFTEHGREWPPLHDLVNAARGRVHGFPESLYQAAERDRANALLAHHRAMAQAREVHAARDRRIEQVGITNAFPIKEPRP